MNAEGLPKAQFAAIKKMASDAQESAANKYFDLNNIMDNIVKYANIGYSLYAVEQRVKFTLRDTAKGKATQAALEAMGFTVSWANRRISPTDKDNPTGEELEYQVMLISWQESLNIRLV